MLDIYNSSTQTVAANGNLSFDSYRINQGGATSFTPGQSTFTLISPGIYKVVFSGIAAATASSTTSPIIVQLKDGATSIPGGIASELSESATDFVNLSFSVLLPVDYSTPFVDNTVTLSLQNAGVAANFSNVDVTVVKVR